MRKFVKIGRIGHLGRALMALSTALVALDIALPASADIPVGASTPRLATTWARALARVSDLDRDRSLDVAAAVHLAEIRTDPSAARLETIERALDRQGDAMTRLRPFSATGGHPEVRGARLVEAGWAHRRSAGFTHFGLAADERGVVALFARRVAALVPLEKVAGGWRLRGRTLPGAATSAWRLGPCLREGAPCSALPERLAVEPLPEGRFEVLFPTPEPGVWTLQLLVDVGAGPEVAFLRRVEGAASEVGASGIRRPVAPPTSNRRKADEAPSGRGGLPLRFADLRAAADRPPLRPHAGLDAAARRHAQAVCASGWAAHRLPGGTDPEERARAAGFDGDVLEGVAVAPSTLDAFSNLAQSPAHLAALLDPFSELYGIGEARGPGRVCLVLLLGRAERVQDPPR